MVCIDKNAFYLSATLITQPGLQVEIQLIDSFLQYFQNENFVIRLQLSRFQFKDRCDKLPGNEPSKKTEVNPSEPNELSKWGPKNIPTSLNICFPIPTCPSDCSNAKIEAPCLANTSGWRQRAVALQI